MSSPNAALTVVKLGGELLEDSERLSDIARTLAAMARSHHLVVVHGGGREIDRQLTRRGVERRSADGIRITDGDTLAVVVAVLGGTINTRLVAAIGAAGARAVGLTGADDRLGLVERAPHLRAADGRMVDVGLVGQPSRQSSTTLLADLCRSGYVPVVASIGVDASGCLLNVNADTLAAHVAVQMGAARLVVAGATDGVLDREGRRIECLDLATVDAMIADGGASAGMVAKLGACRAALAGGVDRIVIVDGRTPENIAAGRGTLLDVAVVVRAVAEEGATKQRTMLTPSTDVMALEARHVLQTYRRTPVVFTRGSGVRLQDEEGRDYLDLISGIGVASLGHAHPRLSEAIASQAATLLHTSNLYFHPLQGQLADRLADLSGMPRAFFCNSGTEAIEACLKFARRYWYTRGETQRTGFVALEHSFHGRTFGSLSVTWDEHYRVPFAPLVPGVTFVPPDKPEAIAAAVSSTTAAVIVEPIQGEGGVRPLSPDFARAVADACARTGTLLIADEVQCGLGRTGIPFYFTALGLQPNLLALGKALGAGVPIGAALLSEDVAQAISFGDHGSTYGGNLLACRAALCFLDELVGNGLLERAGRLGTHIGNELRSLAKRHASVSDVRGAGLMWGLELDRDAAPVVAAAFHRGVLVNRTAERVVRMLPPLVISETDLDSGIALLEQALTDVETGAAT